MKGQSLSTFLGNQLQLFFPQYFEASSALGTSQSFQVPLCIFLPIIPSSGPQPIPQDLGTLTSDKNKLDKQTNPQSFSSSSSSSSKKTTKLQGTEKGPESNTNRDPNILDASVFCLQLRVVRLQALEAQMAELWWKGKINTYRPGDSSSIGCFVLDLPQFENLGLQPITHIFYKKNRCPQIAKQKQCGFWSHI